MHNGKYCGLLYCKFCILCYYLSGHLINLIINTRNVLVFFSFFLLCFIRNSEVHLMEVPKWDTLFYFRFKYKIYFLLFTFYAALLWCYFTIFAIEHFAVCILCSFDWMLFYICHWAICCLHFILLWWNAIYFCNYSLSCLHFMLLWWEAILLLPLSALLFAFYALLIRYYFTSAIEYFTVFILWFLQGCYFCHGALCCLHFMLLW